jgi:hypothetical protein
MFSESNFPPGYYCLPSGFSKHKDDLGRLNFFLGKFCLQCFVDSSHFMNARRGSANSFQASSKKSSVDKLNKQITKLK